MEFQKNLRDFLLYPRHSHGYTLAAQWLKPVDTYASTKSGRFGFFCADIALQNRINSCFQYNTGGCGFNDPRRDIRNASLALTLATFPHQ